MNIHFGSKNIKSYKGVMGSVWVITLFDGTGHIKGKVSQNTFTSYCINEKFYLGFCIIYVLLLSTTNKILVVLGQFPTRSHHE